MMRLLDHFINESTEVTDVYNSVTGITHEREFFDHEKFARLIVQNCIRSFGQTRTEPSLEIYCLQRLGIEDEQST